MEWTLASIRERTDACVKWVAEVAEHAVDEMEDAILGFVHPDTLQTKHRLDIIKLVWPVLDPNDENKVKIMQRWVPRTPANLLRQEAMKAKSKAMKQVPADQLVELLKKKNAQNVAGIEEGAGKMVKEAQKGLQELGLGLKEGKEMMNSMANWAVYWKKTAKKLVSPVYDQLGLDEADIFTFNFESLTDWDDQVNKGLKEAWQEVKEAKVLDLKMDQNGDGKFDLMDLLENKIDDDRPELTLSQQSNFTAVFLPLWTFLVALCWLLGWCAAQKWGSDEEWVHGPKGLESVLWGWTALQVHDVHCADASGWRRSTRCAVPDMRCGDLRLQLWRLLSYQLTHNGIHHIGANVGLNILLGVQLERFHGQWRMAVMWFVGVIGGACFHIMMNPHDTVVGMSGGCYALFGVHFAQVIINWSECKYGKARIILLLLLAAIDTLVARTAEPTAPISYGAHIGGVVFGGLICCVVGRNLMWNGFEIALCCISVISMLVLAAGSLYLGLRWPSQGIGDAHGWCAALQVSSEAHFGDWKYHCVFCSDDACLARWARETYVYLGDEWSCSKLGPPSIYER